MSEAPSTITQPHIVRVFFIQVLSYFACICVGILEFHGLVPSTTIGVFLLFITCMFLYFWPLRATKVDKLFGLIVAVLSFAVAATRFSAVTMFPKSKHFIVLSHKGHEINLNQYGSWAVAFVSLLVLLTIVSFARQMVRESRTNLVRPLSHSLTSSIICASSAGWVFFPDVIYLVNAGYKSAYVFCALGVVLAIVLGCASCTWWKYADKEIADDHTLIGFALIPVLLFGIIVYVLVLGITIAAL